MSGRRSSAVEGALREYARIGAAKANVYRIAAKHGIAATSLYRALASAGQGRHRGCLSGHKNN